MADAEGLYPGEVLPSGIADDDASATAEINGARVVDVDATAGTLPVAGPRLVGRGRHIAHLCWIALRTALVTSIVTLGLLSLVLALFVRFATGDHYDVFGHPAMIVVSGSMSPHIETGDVVVGDRVGGAKASHLRVGTIIMFHPPTGDRSKVITHRIVAVTTASTGAVAYRTKGDANRTVDATPVPASDVIGTESLRLPRLGYVLRAMHRPLIVALSAASVALWVAVGLLGDDTDMSQTSTRSRSDEDGPTTTTNKELSHE